MESLYTDQVHFESILRQPLYTVQYFLFTTCNYHYRKASVLSIKIYGNKRTKYRHYEKPKKKKDQTQKTKLKIPKPFTPPSIIINFCQFTSSNSAFQLSQNKKPLRSFICALVHNSFRLLSAGASLTTLHTNNEPIGIYIAFSHQLY